MKKITLTTILLIILSIFVGCGEKKLEKTSYTVGINTTGYPLGYKYEKGNLTGYEYDILQEMAKRGGFTLNFQDMIFSSIFPKVEENSIDIGIGGYSITEERKKKINFSEYYMTADVVVIGNKENKNIEENDIIYGVEKGVYFKSLIKNGTILEDISKDRMVEKLISKEVDYVIFDKAISNLYTSKYPQLFEKEVLKRDYTAMIISKKLGKEFNEKINKIIIEMKKDGTIDNLKKKYGIVE